MQQNQPKPSRGRRYELEPLQKLGGLGLEVAYLDELSARTTDLIDGLPDEVINFRADGSPNSIGFLCLHMVHCEALWINRSLSNVFDDVIADICGPEPKNDLDTTAEVLTEAMSRCRAEVFKPGIIGLINGDYSFSAPGPFETIDGVLRHISWSWIYHTGQVGLLRRLAGESYRWRFSK